MRHLKYYKVFLEEAEFDVQVTDEPDIKASKEQFGDLEKNIKEYKQKKPLIDNLYLKAKTDEDIKSQIDNIVGKENKNPFLVEYLHVASLSRKINNIQKDITLDKLKKDFYSLYLLYSLS